MDAERCEDCRAECPVWYADHDRWNFVTAHMPRGRASILCPNCFCTRWTTTTNLAATWHLVPEDMRPVDETEVHYVCVARDEMSPPPERAPVFFRGHVSSYGSGEVTIQVERDTDVYPRVGTHVVVDELAG